MTTKEQGFTELLLIHPLCAITHEQLTQFAKGVNTLRSMGLSGRSLLSLGGTNTSIGATWVEYQDGITRAKESGIEIDDTETLLNDDNRIMEVEVIYERTTHCQWKEIRSINFTALNRDLTATMYKRVGHVKLDRFIRQNLPLGTLRVVVHVLRDGSFDIIDSDSPSRR